MNIFYVIGCKNMHTVLLKLYNQFTWTYSTKSYVKMYTLLWRRIYGFYWLTSVEIKKLKYLIVTMLESLNYSVRNLPKIIWVICRIKQLGNYKKTMGFSEDPSLINNVDELCLVKNGSLTFLIILFCIRDLHSSCTDYVARRNVICLIL